MNQSNKSGTNFQSNKSSIFFQVSKPSASLQGNKSSTNSQSSKSSTSFQDNKSRSFHQPQKSSAAPRIYKSSANLQSRPAGKNLPQNPALQAKIADSKDFHPPESKKIRVKRKSRLLAICARLSVWGAALFVTATVLIIIGYILGEGIPHLRPTLFAWHYTSENVSLMPSVINTVTLTAIALAFAVPVGVFSAVYLCEYAPRQSRLVRIIRLTAETLAGIPSIVFGLFGYLVFHTLFGWGYSLLGGALTLSLMVLPMIIRTAEEALLAVPDSYREGSFGLGAGKLRTTMRVVLPSAVPGILSGVILGVGRIVGETAALIYTAGSVSGIAEDVMSSGRTLAVHMYALLSEGLYINEAKATAVVLLVFVLLINIASRRIAKRLKGGGK